MERRIVLNVITSAICLFTCDAFGEARMCTDQKTVPVPFPTFTEVTLSRDVTPMEEYVAKLFMRLNGAPPSFHDPRFRRVVNLIQAGDLLGGARLALTDPNFLKVRVRSFSIPFIQREFQPKDTLTDLQALIIGITRDELDARLLLTGDIRYQGHRSLGLPAVSRANNDHYAALESRDLDYDALERLNKQWDEPIPAAGALTTRAWAAAYYDGGTNRKAVKYALDAFLCQPIDTWKIRGLPDYFVRRDVDRAPGRDPSKYQNDCRNCHSAMDGFGGAFAKYDFVGGEFRFTSEGVAPKMNNNPQFYPAGYVTIDDSWVNLLTAHPTVDFGWQGATSGIGILSFATSLASSRAFSQCMVQRVFAELCGSAIMQTAPEALRPLADQFEKNGFVFKELFANVVILDSCLSHPNKESL